MFALVRLPSFAYLRSLTFVCLTSFAWLRSLAFVRLPSFAWRRLLLSKNKITKIKNINKKKLTKIYFPSFSCLRTLPSFAAYVRLPSSAWRRLLDFFCLTSVAWRRLILSWILITKIKNIYKKKANQNLLSVVFLPSFAAYVRLPSSAWRRLLTVVCLPSLALLRLLSVVCLTSFASYKDF